MRKRLEVPARELLGRPPGGPEACAAALQYLYILDGIAAAPDQKNGRRSVADARVELGRILVRAAAGELSPLRRSGKAQPLPEAAAFLEDD